MSNYAPSSAKELYDTMLTWADLRGGITYDEKSQALTWVIAEDLRLEIYIWNGEGTVHVFDSGQPKILELTHWHSDADILYQEVLDGKWTHDKLLQYAEEGYMDINKGNVKFAYIHTLFGKHIVYVGFSAQKKKHRFRLIHYLGEKPAQ